jgi:hypothetical protein
MVSKGYFPCFALSLLLEESEDLVGLTAPLALIKLEATGVGAGPLVGGWLFEVEEGVEDLLLDTWPCAIPPFTGRVPLPLRK